MERAPSLLSGFPEYHHYLWTRPTPDRASGWLSASAFYRPYSPDRTEPYQRETRSGLPGSCRPLSDHAARKHD